MEADSSMVDAQLENTKQEDDRDSGFNEASDGSVNGMMEDKADTQVPGGATQETVRAESPKQDAPPLSTQIKTIETLLQAYGQTSLLEGDEAFLVSRTWLARAQSIGDAKNDQAADVEVGPVDNSDIALRVVQDLEGKQVVQLKPGLGQESFEIFPKDAWDLLMAWHGLAKGQIPIWRTTINTSPDGALPNISFQMHPPTLTVYRLWSDVSPLPVDAQLKAAPPEPYVVMCSTTTPFVEFLRKAKTASKIPMERKVRTWRVPQKLPAAPLSLSTPPESPKGADEVTSDKGWSTALVDVMTFTSLIVPDDRELVRDAKDNTANVNYNGRMDLGVAGLSVSQTVVLDEQIEGDSYVSNFSGTLASRSKANVVNRGSSTSLNHSGRQSPAPSGGMMTRGRQQRAGGRVQGTTGLSNLGNTCYMNSALQCVRSVEELTKYFLLDEDVKELNVDNPLGHNGNVARAYGKLLHEIYKMPAPSSVVPRNFKNIVGRYAPAFSGYGQQDSQEFLGFLLDGLQEDLSRVRKKPYIEKPDSTDDMINNPEAIAEMADKVWDITKQRDDSVVADLFTGMYKSTLVCPICHKVSITFDPFNNLTLPLPIRSLWSHKVTYFPLNAPPVILDVELDKNTSIRALKEFISARVGVPVERLMGSEDFREKFYKHYEDFGCVSDEIGNNDRPNFYELEAVPTNLRGPRKPRPQKSAFKSLLLEDNVSDTETTEEADPQAERLLVPILHRFTESPNQVHGGERSLEGLPPHFIIVTPSEARDLDKIRRKILEKVATYTTSKELDDDSSDASETVEPEAAHTSTSDGDSSDSKVVARSVEGEDDMVDVTMNDNSKVRKPRAARADSTARPSILRKFNRQRPAWLDPDVYMGSVDGLFTMSYLTDDNSAYLPTGWNVANDPPTRFPLLQTRVPKSESDHDMQTPSTIQDESGSDNDGSDEDEDIPAILPPTRMIDEVSSDESSDSLPMVQNLGVRPSVPNNLPHRAGEARGGRKKVKAHRTYSKKSERKLAKQQRAMARRAAARKQQTARQQSPMEPDNSPGPLIRPGEAIICHWDPNSVGALFGKDPRDQLDQMRGAPTFTELETLEDPQLQAKKQVREKRRRHGITLDECLDEFEKDEILSEQDMWYCPRCKEHRRASKKFDLWKTPDILIVHLKRFSSSGYRRDKLDVNVDFPIEGLDLSERVIEKSDGRQEIYDLIGVDDHWGGLGGGHYTAYGKNFVDEQWYEYNDTSVHKLSNLDKMISSAAYLLFYRRRSEHALGGPKFQEIMERYDNQGSDDEGSSSDAGEGQRLGIHSSRNGLSSALTGAGAGATRREDRGSASGADDLPPYTDKADSDEITLIEHNGMRNSIEGSRHGGGIAAATQANWSFNSVDRSADLGLDYASDDAQAASSDDAGGARSEPTLDHDMIFGDDSTAGADESEIETQHFEEVPPPPALSGVDQMGLDEIRDQAWENRHIHTVGADDLDDASDKAVIDIHIPDDEEVGGT